jgi:hypothetical protein
LVLYFSSTPGDCETSTYAADSDKDEDDDELLWFSQSASAESASRECIDTQTQENALLVEALDAAANAYANLHIVSIPKELLDVMLRYVSTAYHYMLLTYFFLFSTNSSCATYYLYDAAPHNDSTVAAVGPAALVAQLPAVRASRDKLSGSVVARQAPRDFPTAN